LLPVPAADPTGPLAIFEGLELPRLITGADSGRRHRIRAEALDLRGVETRAGNVVWSDGVRSDVHGWR